MFVPLLGIDLHLGWCGRCQTMEQNYRNLFTAYDDDYVKIEFFAASEEHIPEEVMSSLKFGPLTCKPRFVLYYGGEKREEIDGADHTALETSIGKNIPTFDD